MFPFPVFSFCLCFRFTITLSLPVAVFLSSSCVLKVRVFFLWPAALQETRHGNVYLSSLLWMGHVYCARTSLVPGYIVIVALSASLHGDSGDSPTRPSVSKLFPLLQIRTSWGPHFIFKGVGHNISQLALGSWKHDWQPYTLLFFLCLSYKSPWWLCYIKESKEGRWRESGVWWWQKTARDLESLNRGELSANKSINVDWYLNFALFKTSHLLPLLGLLSCNVAAPWRFDCICLFTLWCKGEWTFSEAHTVGFFWERMLFLKTLSLRIPG